jgi:glycosyltransferase involved in cell wall biosynthesis
MVLLISRLRKFRYIAQLHIDFKPSGPAGILLPLYKQLLLKPVLQSAAAVFVLNEQTAQNVRSTYNYNGKIHIVNNGIDDAYFAVERLALEPTPPSTLQLLFVGRLSKQKNINALLRALRLTKRSVHVDLVGDGEERESVLRAIAEYGLRNITLHGRLSREAVMKLYQTCHALVLPSLYEAQPLVLLEAMAAQIPIIGTDVIGVAEHIRDAGIIVEPSPEGIAKGFDQYYYRYSRLPEMIKQGYKAAQNLRWAHNLKHYEALYEDISRS